MKTIKNLFIVALLAQILSVNCKVGEKKIELQDIEQDTLNSEQSKNSDNEDEYQTATHQYDVEEPNNPDTPYIVYAGNNYNTEAQYVSPVQTVPTETAYPNVEHNYITAMPMQIVYLHQYDPNQYQQTAQPQNYYYQPQEPHKESNADEQKQNGYINYVTIPTQAPLVQLAPGYVISMQYAQPEKQLSVKPQPGYHFPTLIKSLNENQAKYLPPQSHVNHIPRVLPQYAHAVSRPIYSHISGKLVADNSPHTHTKNNLYYPQKSYQAQDSFGFGDFIKRKPSSLLESYIPSSIQIEYLKRGLSKEPLSTYDTVASSHGFPAKNFERGFLPNQMYPTAAGGVTFGHFKRAVKSK